MTGERGDIGPAGSRGEKGDMGPIGMGFDDFEETLDEDGRTIVRTFKRGDDIRVVRHVLPIVIDRGVWKDTFYLKGDGVTWAGSFWIAQYDTSDKPETSKAWRLAVKRGRDGKDGSKGDPGPAGRDGKDGSWR